MKKALVFFLTLGLLSTIFLAGCGESTSETVRESASETVSESASETVSESESESTDISIMPDVVGQDYRLAQATLEVTYGVIVDISFVYNDTVDSYLVISTEPAAGANLTKGQTVTITASRGASSQAITVPNFLNMNITEAQAVAEELGLYVQDIQETQDSRAKGTVIYQSLSAGTLAQEGDNIIFYVSNGQEAAVTSTELSPSGELSTEPSTEPFTVPSVVPSTEPSQFEEPAQSSEPDTVITVNRIIDVNLSDYAGEESVTVTVTVGGVTQVNSVVDTSVGTYEAKISGNGTQNVAVFIDGTQVASFDESFS